MSKSLTMPFFLVTLSATLSWLSGTVAFAGSYQLTSGEDAPICEAYRRNFEPRHDSEPMACERQYDLTIAGFSSPPWRKLDFKKHFELYKQAEFNLAINDSDGTVPSEADAREMVRHLDERRNHLATELYVTRLDLFGTGHPVNILSVKERACGIDPKPNMRISRLFVLNDSMTHINRRLQERIEAWSNNATIELFNGEPYIEAYSSDDNWAHLFTSSGTLSIAKFRAAVEVVCRVKFEPGA